MVRTQVQLPDELYERTKRLAESKEISLAELVRRGLEYMLSIHRPDLVVRRGWKLDAPSDVGLLRDPFADADWRVAANTGVSDGTNAHMLLLNDGQGRRP